MSITVTGKNKMLDALLLERISLHTGFPGATGANEVSGGTYARVAATFGAASAGARSLGSAVTLNVPACTVAWVGVWNAAGTVFAAYSPNGGNPKEFQADAAADTIRCPAHGYADGQTVTMYGDTVPGGLTEGAVYYVRDATADTFKLAASSGGAVIDLTSAGGSACVVSAITLEVYGAAGTHTVNTWSIGLPH